MVMFPVAQFRVQEGDELVELHLGRHQARFQVGLDLIQQVLDERLALLHFVHAEDLFDLVEVEEESARVDKEEEGLE